MHEKDNSCTHQLTTVNSHGMVACAHCRTVEWFTPQGRADAHAGMTAAFGNFDLSATLRGLGNAAPDVTIYAPGSAADRRALAALPVRAWLQVEPRFWISSDGDHLLISVEPTYEVTLSDDAPLLSLVPALS
jgi:hypothetical protein